MTDPNVPTASFMNFLGGLAAQGLMQLGEIPNPMTGTRDRNLPYARYTFQLLDILNQKTAGNRTKEEDDYLRSVLSDLKSRLERAEADV
jgi:hypothetical protein